MRRYGSGTGWNAVEAAKEKKRRMHEIKTGAISPLTTKQRNIVYLLSSLAVLISVLLMITISCTCGGSVSENRNIPSQNQNQIQSEILPKATAYPRSLTSDYERLPASYIPPDLTFLTGVPGGELKLRLDAAGQFVELYNAMVSGGMAMVPLSAYRSNADFLILYNDSITEYAEKMTVKQAKELLEIRIGSPGRDEHQLGYSISVSANGKMDLKFMSSDQGKWLKANAANYGFIFRFPEDKKNITGRVSPWEMRYVGVDTAKYMTDRNICLEEYIKLIREKYPDIQAEEE